MKKEEEIAGVILKGIKKKYAKNVFKLVKEPSLPSFKMYLNKIMENIVLEVETVLDRLVNLSVSKYQW